jgi:hypothetical protein
MGTYAGRPATDAITVASYYARLAKAQNRVVALISAVAPNSLYPKVAYGSLPTLTTTDNQIYTFGTDSNSYANFPMGHGGIYSSLNDIPDAPLQEGWDYMNEGTQIRATNNTTLPATLYWYGIAQPVDLDATHQPVLLPEASRELIVIEAVRRFSQEFLRNAPLVDEMNNEWERAWPIWCMVWKTQFMSGGALGVWTGRDLALASGGGSNYGY